MKTCRWAKLDQDIHGRTIWGARYPGEPEVGEVVQMVKADGNQSLAMVTRIVRQYPDNALCYIRDMELGGKEG